jgi:anthranilate phosphoribosyltransferase
VIEALLGRLSAGEDLTMEEMSDAIEAVVSGAVSDGQVGLLLMALRTKGETAQEIAGAAMALRRHMTPLRTKRPGGSDPCGTGGDGASTFNISTAAAGVVAAAGVPVAKHGNRGVTSKTGSADALAALGVNIAADLARVEQCLDELGICFCFAPLMHPSMKRVAEVRRKLGVPTIFNLLGPLANPASAPLQVVGCGQPELRALLAEALALLGSHRALVVQGEDGLDEVTLCGPTRVTEVSRGELRNFTWTPSDFGLEPSALDSLTVDGPEASASVIQEVLLGVQGPKRDIVLLNAAAALWTAGRADSPRAGAEMASIAIDSGAASALLARLVELTNR